MLLIQTRSKIENANKLPHKCLKIFLLWGEKPNLFVSCVFSGVITQPEVPNMGVTDGGSLCSWGVSDKLTIKTLPTSCDSHLRVADRSLTPSVTGSAPSSSSMHLPVWWKTFITPQRTGHLKMLFVLFVIGSPIFKELLAAFSEQKKNKKRDSPTTKHHRHLSKSFCSAGVSRAQLGSLQTEPCCFRPLDEAVKTKLCALCCE